MIDDPAAGPVLSAGPPAAGGSAGALVRLCRPRQAAKNVVVLAAPACAGVLGSPGTLGRALEAVALFAMVGAGTYALNDTVDRVADRAHPRKATRPIASGALSVRTGYLTAGALLGASVGLALLVTWRLALVLGVYAVVQVAYTYRLKHLPVYDLAAVAFGFLLRAIAGGVATGVALSQWFLLVATFGSLLMVTGKRLAEHAELGDGRGAHRATLDAYSTTFLRTAVAVAASGSIVCYCLWAFDLQTAMRHHDDPIWFQLTIAPVALALLRYTLLVDLGRGARPDELVLGDRQLQVLGVVWAALFALGVYVH
ncbi:MAG TPA: decaprenyl-phosphate phosphoribosyltransferase [Acidimicrobiales bacterium]|nr:decaprenyl-phosphate phosphoribosyltransferase [Acidimicrobiales bacterium]